MHKKLICLALCLALPITVLSGCGNKERTLVFKHFDIDNQQAYKTLADNYSNEHEGLTIEVQAIDPEKYTDTLLLSFSQKETTDVLAIPSVKDLQRLIDSERLLDLSKSKDLIPSDYFSGLQQIGSRDDHTWALPITGCVPVIFYNKEVYKEFSLVVPQTVPDFIVNCLLIQQNGLNPFALSTDDKGVYDTADFIEGILVNGSRDTPLLTSGKFFDGNTMLDSGFGDAVGLSNEMNMSNLLVAKENSVQGHEALLEQFVSGACTMISGTTNDIRKLQELKSDFSFGFFPMPGTNGSLAGVFKTNMMLGIAKDTKIKSDAEGFVSYLLSASSQDFLCNQTLTIPASDNISLSDSNLALAQTWLTTANGVYMSIFQRISGTEEKICLEQLDLAFSGSADDLEAFMQNWADEIKAVS